MTAPSRAREAEPIYFGAPPGREYQDELPADEMVPDAKDTFVAPSVTTILKAGLPTKWALRNWDRTTVAEAAVDNPHVWSQMRRPDGSFDRQAAVDYIRTAPDRSLGEASNRGTDVHAIMEAIAKGEVVPLIGPGREPWVRAVQRFFKDFRPVPVWVEVTVYSRRSTLRYAGTLDLICWLPTGPGGEWELWQIDLKTGKGVYGDMAYQQVAYNDAEYGIVRAGSSKGEDGWERAPIPKVHRFGILNAREDGTYDLKELVPTEAQRGTARTMFALPYELCDTGKDESKLVGPTVPIPGRLEAQVYASWLVRRCQAVWQHDQQAEPEWRGAVALLAQGWPEGVPPIPEAATWTYAQCEAVDEVLQAVEADFSLPFDPPPAQRTVQPEPQAPDPFAGLPDMAKPDPLRAAADAARGAEPYQGEPNDPFPLDVEKLRAELDAWVEQDGEGFHLALGEDYTDEEAVAALQGFRDAHQGRNPTAQAHYQAQLDRLARHQGPPTTEPPVSDEGLTQRQAEQYAEHAAAVERMLADLPIDRVRLLDGWKARTGVPHLGRIKADREGLRHMELVHGEVMRQHLEHEAQVAKLERLLEDIMPGSPDAWAHLQAIAVAGDGSYVSDPHPDGDAAGWKPKELTAAQCALVGYLALASQQLVLFWTSHEPTGGMRLDVNQEAARKALKGLGSATEVKNRAREAALRHGIHSRPTSLAQVMADPILVALLLPVAE